VGWEAQRAAGELREIPASTPADLPFVDSMSRSAFSPMLA
jgi:hypothetical protein